MSILKAPIDLKSLEEEIRAALAADELYKKRNDAKIRAVEQGAPTYEHFRQMVNAAHLKPLDRDDMKPKIGARWNLLTSSVASRRSAVSSEKLKSDKANNEDVETKSPETCEEFLNFWRKTESCSLKFFYLSNLRKILRSHIFRIEIPATFFGDCMNVCRKYLSDEDDVTSVVEVLGELSTCNRFGLTVCFMTKEERSMCEQLFQQLRLRGSSKDEALEGAIVSLAEKYGIKVT